MKIIYISKYGSYNPYGIDTRHIYISRELVRQGHEVCLYLSDSNHQLKQIPKNYEQTVDGVNVYWIKTKKYSRAYGLSRILSWFDFEYKLRRRLKNSSQIDVTIVSSLSLLSIFNGIFLKSKHRCKLVFEVRDIWPLVLRRISTITRFNPFYRFLAYAERRGYSKADLIVGTMPNLKDHVSSRMKTERKVLWIPHLINPSMKYEGFHKHEVELLQFKQRFQKIVGYAGSVNRSSSLRVLLETTQEESMRKIGFVILGEGPLLEELKQKYSRKNVRFFDKIPQQEVVAFLKQCDILYDGYLKSDIYKFGNSRNKYVEYCLSSKPVIIGYEGYPLFFENENAGMIVQPEDKEGLLKGLQLLVNKDKEELTTMGNKAYKFAINNLNVQVQTKKLLEAIEDV